METEMERLKRNADEQLAKDRYESIRLWMEEVQKEWDKATDEFERNFKWMMIVLVVQVILGFVINSAFWIVCFFLFLILDGVNSRIRERCEYCNGRLIGAHKMLFLLGLADSDIEDEINRKMKQRRRVTFLNPFKRFKEFHERMKEGKTEKQHA